jgi:hypothetical protein
LRRTRRRRMRPAGTVRPGPRAGGRVAGAARRRPGPAAASTGTTARLGRSQGGELPPTRIPAARAACLHRPGLPSDRRARRGRPRRGPATSARRRTAARRRRRDPRRQRGQRAAEKRLRRDGGSSPLQKAALRHRSLVALLCCPAAQHNHCWSSYRPQSQFEMMLNCQLQLARLQKDFERPLMPMMLRMSKSSSPIYHGQLWA